MANALAPSTHDEIARFGNGDQRKAATYATMIAGFLGGLNDNTRRSYTCAIRQFFTLFDWISPESVTPAHAAAFKKWLLTHKEVSRATTYYRLCALTSLFRYLQQPPSPNADPLIASNPFDSVPKRDIAPTPYSDAKAMDWDTFDAIVKSIPLTVTGLRNKAVLLFFAYTGRRRAEVAGLRVRDIDFKSTPPSYTVTVKGGKRKTFELPETCGVAIRAYWLAADRLDSLGSDDGVFIATHDTSLTRNLERNKPITDRMMNWILTHAAQDAGVDMEGVKIHAIRHMVARDLDSAGVPIQDIQTFLGHASPVTTQVYLDKLSGPISAHESILLKVRNQAANLGRGLSPSESE